MKKVFDQTVRDLKREVNKKVLKIPGIEQKILDATNNEPWGPHGLLLVDIAQATRSYQEYQIVMSVIWKRINDTGKNWRHVYKGLTVLEHLVAHGSERVIDEIREHAYQISTLSGFQYVDSSGRDQGSNVRKKAQSLVALVNNKERVQEVRQKAYANRDKYHSATGGMHRPSSSKGYGDRYDDEHDDGCYGNRDDDRNSYERERERRYRDDGRDVRGRDSYGQDGDQYSKDSDEQCDRNGYKDADYKGSKGNDDCHSGSRGRSIDKDTDRSFDEYHQYSPRHLETKNSDKSLGAPPSYEEAIGEHQHHVQNEKAGGGIQPPEPKAPSPPSPKASSAETIDHGQTIAVADTVVSDINKQIDVFDEFNPRGSATADAPAGTSSEMDIFGLSDVDSINSMVLMPVTADAICEADIPNADPGTNFSAVSAASNGFNQFADNPFGEFTFEAIPQDSNTLVQQQNFAPVTSFQLPTVSMSNSPAPQPVTPEMHSTANFDFGDSFLALIPSVINGQVSPTTSDFLPPELQAPPTDVVAPGNILPLMGTATEPSSHVSQLGSSSAELTTRNALSQPGLSTPFDSQAYAPSFLSHTSATLPHQVPPYSLPQLGSAEARPVSQSFPASHLSQPGQSDRMAAPADPLNILSQPGLTVSAASQVVPSPMLGLSAPLVSQAIPATTFSLTGPSASGASQPVPPTTTGPPAKSMQQKDKFETKSTVWADTLSRGLVNLNISGPKTNPLADIGIDFDSINRKEKRKERENSSVPAVPTVTMGKAMGAGSGMGRAGASALVPPPNPMMGSGMGMGMGMANGGMGMGMGMGGGYGAGMNQPIGMGMGMGMGMNMGMGMATNAGMGQGMAMQPPGGLPSGPAMPGLGYNPVMGMGGYGSQQQYGGYR